jgi:hypothetical protein
MRPYLKNNWSDKGLEAWLKWQSAFLASMKPWGTPPQKKEKMTVGAKAQKVVFNPGVFYFQGFQFKTGHQNVWSPSNFQIILFWYYHTSMKAKSLTFVL